MNTFNRVLLVLILTVIGALAVAVIFFAWADPVGASNTLDEGVTWLQQNQDTLEKTLVSTGAALVALVVITLLYLELVPRSSSQVLITDLHAGNALLSTDAISQRVEEAVSQVRHVSAVRAHVVAKRKGVTVDLDLHVEPLANLAVVTDEACEAARDVLTNRVHVALLEAPKARLHYREIRRERAVARRPVLAPAAASSAPAPASVATRAPTAENGHTQVTRRNDLLENSGSQREALDAPETDLVPAIPEHVPTTAPVSEAASERETSLRAAGPEPDQQAAAGPPSEQYIPDEQAKIDSQPEAPALSQGQEPRPDSENERRPGIDQPRRI